MTDALLFGAVLLATFAWSATTIWYSVRAKWWRNEYGINTWAVSFIISFTMVRLCVLIAYPGLQDHAVNTWIGVCTYVALAISGAHRLYLLEKAQREGETGLHRRSTDKTT